MSDYRVCEIFSTLQGEGARAGCRSVFVRFSGCNLWNGIPADRSKGKGACALCCDTDFVDGRKMSAESIRLALSALWSDNLQGERWCVLSGGEPLLQVDMPLVNELHSHGWRIAIETNGTLDKSVLDSIDHVCVSPKLGAPIERKRAHELKVILPGHRFFDAGWSDGQLTNLQESGEWDALFVQPQDPIDAKAVNESYLTVSSMDSFQGQALYERNVKRCLDFVAKHPDWRLSLQLHKYVQIP